MIKLNTNIGIEGLMEEGYYIVTSNDVACIVGGAVREVPGVSDLKNNMMDLFKARSDWSKGVSVWLNSKDEADVHVKLIVDSEHDAADILADATDTIAKALENVGVQPHKVAVEVAQKAA